MLRPKHSTSRPFTHSLRHPRRAHLPSTPPLPVSPPPCPLCVAVLFRIAGELRATGKHTSDLHALTSLHSPKQYGTPANAHWNRTMLADGYSGATVGVSASPGGGGEAGAEASSLLASAAAAGQNGTALEQARRSRRVLAPRVRGGGGERKGEGAGEEYAAAVAGLDAVLGAGLGLAAAALRTGRRGRGVSAQGLGVAPPPQRGWALAGRGGMPGAAEQRAVSGSAQRSRAVREVASEAERIESELGKGAARDGILRKASGSAGRVERRRRRVEGGIGRHRDFG
ncbi:uncharacterized protein [Miscanthus floridulus]|uniref:uncharacterized protein n=1 Tax=Miscanthus floridulus TaxID=154761 RepID=UPI003458CA25